MQENDGHYTYRGIDAIRGGQTLNLGRTDTIQGRMETIQGTDTM